MFYIEGYLDCAVIIAIVYPGVLNNRNFFMENIQVKESHELSFLLLSLTVGHNFSVKILDGISKSALSLLLQEATKEKICCIDRSRQVVFPCNIQFASHKKTS